MLWKKLLNNQIKLIKYNEINNFECELKLDYVVNWKACNSKETRETPTPSEIGFVSVDQNEILLL